ncbi:preprotein translocase subunit YajC [Treponema ruminis]|uniref:Sec translocon accessory complex subunit YajC n=1 Tax=Treponema ruminis TaxID=744515 RepID=A0A7W8G8F9_9SPIR|nr:preprotein translocase subunit YajC [Treponema ruminis]MBB5225788.1 preprotein translocase subunit YajC [Treponema ruminis]QSI02478.1 preprotein translocase subunit YajC [Treponema ruminis]
MFLSLLQANPATGSQTLMSVVPFVLIIAIFYFFIIRPQNKKQKETQKMIDALKKGDKVVTIGGIHGVVTSTKEKTVILKVDENVKIEVNRSAVAGVEKESAPSKSEKKADESKEASKEESSDSTKSE